MEEAGGTAEAGTGEVDTGEVEAVGETGKASSKTRRTQRTEWRRRTREAFLDHLAVTGSVEQSAHAVGRTGAAAHALRRRDPAFGLAWSEALDAACERLQTQLIGRAMGNVASEDGDAGADGGGDGGGARRIAPGMECPRCGAAGGAAGGEAFNPELALKVLSHRAMIAVKPPRLGHRSSYRRIPIAEVEESLARKIVAILKLRGPE